ncbi:MAG: DUF4091 domain-containing protein [Defluviitaleaceae bacterium]|nr:DUF4091 domain-containing protein [Defluviitaleaceae bacterium]
MQTDTHLELRLLSSLAKVFPHHAPPAQHEKHWLTALGGEIVSFQLAYMLQKGRHRSWAELMIDAPSEVSVNVRRVRYIAGYMPPNFKTDDGYISSDDGLFPDLLEPLDLNRLPLIPGVWQSCWIDISVAPDTTAGHYPIRISIQTPDGEIFAETSLEVIPADLPPLDIPHTKWFHTDCLATYYGVDAFSEKHWEIIENFAAYAVQHGINTLLTPIHTPPLDTEVGGERLTIQLIDITATDDGYVFGFDKLERWVDMCRRIGVAYYEMAHLFTQWGAKHAPKIIGVKNGKYTRLFGWETDASGLEYADYLKQMLPALTSKLKEWGIADKTLFHISDEPSLEHMDAYMAARKIVEPLLQGFKIVDALTNYDFYKQGAVSVPIPAVDHIEPFLKGKVPELWCYYCCVQSYKVPNHFFMQPSYRNRILGVLLYKYDIAGFLHWGYNFYNCMHSIYPIDPYRVTDADGAFPSGDAFMVYPGADGQPLASLRLMVAQEAFNDLRALRLLEKLSGRDAVLALIDENLAEPVTFSNFPQTEAYLLSLRRRVNQMIGALTNSSAS